MMPKGGVAKALQFLASEQLDGGGFVSLSSRTDMFNEAISYQTTFFPSLILSSLASIEGAGSIRSRIASFLLMQKSPGWSYNYWDRQSRQAIACPYPDDLDDTFCALAALSQECPQLIRGEALATIAHLLISTEVETGGPYRTWLIDDSAPAVWRDVDVVVNANIGYFLSLQSVILPNLKLYMERALQMSVASPYYPDQYAPLYFISRWYKGPKSQIITDRLLLDQQDGHWKNPLRTALAISTLLRSGYSPQQLTPAIAYLRESQAPDGSWPAAAFCVDPAIKGQMHQAGSASLTTAFCLEALQLFDVNSNKTALLPTVKATLPAYTNVAHEVSRTITRLPHADLRRQTKKVLSRILKRDIDGQVIMLPWFIAKAAGLEIKQEVLKNLALGSLWGWMAYTTYDDFLDAEGDPKFLPSANVCMRNLVATHARTLSQNDEFQTEIQTIMDRLDAANAWEVCNCRGAVRDNQLYISRIPDYGNLWQLADRSLGHTIAGLGVLYASGLTTNEPTLQALRHFFKHYLIARQLNDDAHDWEEDLQAGHVNAVAVLVLRRWEAAGNSLRGGINLDHQMGYLRRTMWEKTILDVCNLVDYHASQAMLAVRQVDVGLNDQMLQVMLTPLQQAAQRALEKRDEALDFITAL